MPANNPNEEATQELTIQKQTFLVPLPYVEGPCTLTSGEAAALNQTYAENIRNNFAQRMKAAAEGENPRALTQEDLDAYCDDYEFGRRQGGGRRVRDPVGREERLLATVALRTKVEAAKLVWKDYPEEKKNALIAQIVESGRFRAEAEAIVAAKTASAAAANAKTEDLNLDLAA